MYNVVGELSIMKIKHLENIKAVIFDLDGTLLDSCKVWFEVDKKFFAKRGREVPKDYGKTIGTMGLAQAAVYTKHTYGIEETPEEIFSEWMDMVVEKYSDEVELKPHAKAYLEYLSQNDVPLAVATASSRVMYEPCLKNNGIYYYFDHICDVKKFKDGKNSPELFLYVASLLECEPSEILIFEDTLHAIKVALDAGFNVCAVYEETCRDEKEKQEISSLYIHDFKELLE